MSEPTQAAKPALGVIRRIFAVIGILIMVFAGGCTLIVGFPMIGGPDFSGMGAMLLLFGGLPFLFGLLLWWLAVKAGR